MAKLKKDITAQEAAADTFQEKGAETTVESTSDSTSDGERSAAQTDEGAEQPQSSEDNEQGAGAEQGAPTTETKTLESSAEAATPPKEKAKESKEEGSQEPDSRTLAVLKRFPKYESLYVDRSGSVFTLGTPERIRGGAKLYTNPYFNPQ